MAERTDRGFTLPELTIVIVLIGFIAAVLSAAVTVVLRSSPSTQARSESARTYHGITTHLPRDVASTPADGFLWYQGAAVPPAAGDTCTGNADTSNLVLLMEWADAGTGDQFTAEYRNDSNRELLRHSCVGGVGGFVTNSMTLELDALTATAQVSDSPLGPDYRDVLLTVTATGEDGSPVTSEFDATSRNPKDFHP